MGDTTGCCCKGVAVPNIPVGWKTTRFCIGEAVERGDEGDKPTAKIGRCQRA